VRVGLATTEAGQGGRPLLLVHGFTGAREDFHDHVDAFAAAGWHVVVPDLPGHGDSHPEDVVHGFDAYAGIVLALADDLGWDRFALLGHSMGGVVAQHVALVAPHRLTALVLMDTSPDRFEVDAGLVDAACDIVSTHGMAALLAVQKEIGSPLETDAARRVRMERPGWEQKQDSKLLRAAPSMYVAMSRALIAAPSRSEQLAQLVTPTLVIVGEQDAPLLDASARLAAAIPGARFVRIPDAGHSPQVEAPERWFETVVEFLDEVVASGRSR
jgi:3-oxoadipate enol-lactonase